MYSIYHVTMLHVNLDNKPAPGLLMVLRAASILLGGGDVNTAPATAADNIPDPM